MNLLPRHRRSQVGEKSPPPTEMPPMIKIITTKLYVFQLFQAFPRILQYTSTTH